MDDGNIINAKARGKLRSVRKLQINQKSESKKEVLTTIKDSPKVGDIVYIDNSLIDHFDERKNELIRPDIANVDQILLVFAAKEPDFQFYLLDLFIVNIIKQNIKPLIVISKIDLLNDKELEELKLKLSYYTNLGYEVLFVDSKTKKGIEDVKLHLENKITVLSGQTGAGKSTLINAIIPDFELQTQEISKSLGRGKHTTRETNLYPYLNGFIGDTPGFSKLSLIGIEKNELKNLFVEFKNCHCKFNDCNHTQSIQGCVVRKLVDDGLILKERYDSYLKMYNEKEVIK